MLPTSHLAATYILWIILVRLFGDGVNSLLLAIVMGVLIDADAIFLGSMHRLSILHSLALWLPALLIGFLLDIPYYWTCIFAIVHILLDSLDWGVYVFYPLSTKLWGPRLIAKNSILNPRKNSIVDFTKEYLGHKFFLFLEAFLCTTALIIFLFVGIS